MRRCRAHANVDQDAIVCRVYLRIVVVVVVSTKDSPVGSVENKNEVARARDLLVIT